MVLPPALASQERLFWRRRIRTHAEMLATTRTDNQSARCSVRIVRVRIARRSYPRRLIWLMKFGGEV